MRTKSLWIIGLGLGLFPLGAEAVPVLETTDFIADSSRTNFNGFEAIPNDGLFYTGGSAPYVEGGIRVAQINADPGNDIWINFSTAEGFRSWYPNGGDFGYTMITLASGGEFENFGFYAGTGGGPTHVLFDLLLNGVSVLSGSREAASQGQFVYLGFSGGGFDTVLVRDNCGHGPSFDDGTCNALTLDAIETAGPASAVPEPGTMGVIGLGLLGAALVRKRR